MKNDFLKYSAMATQMIVIIGGGVLLGRWLDNKYHIESHAWTLTFAIISVVVAMYTTIKDLLKK